MDTINWLHLRGLALLALLGLFVMYAVLAAFWQDWRVKRRTRRVPKQDASLTAEPFASGTVSPAAKPHAWRDERSAAGLIRRAA
jgi:cytochrome oxidase assembly protein ShyY1